MSFDSKKREEIKKYILWKISADDRELLAKTIDSFGISITSVKRYMKELTECGAITPQADCACGYCLTEYVAEENISLSGNQMEEDRLYAVLIEGNLKSCDTNALRIWQYVCAEMLNNAIEHSRGGNIHITVSRNALFSRIVIADDGVGVFQTLVEYMAEHGWSNPCAEDALIELYKGKFTSDASRHSGEGIFFSSKAVDEFAIWSGAKIYKCGYGKNIDVTEHRLLAYVSRIEKIGTVVMMTLENETPRRLSEVFNMYTSVEEGFVRTRIPVKEACLTGEPVARSQARRICNRLDEFREIILDFDRVEVMGQGFADELFRVYALAHPQVALCPINMVSEVEQMIRHVSRGQVPENVRMNTNPLNCSPPNLDKSL